MGSALRSLGRTGLAVVLAAWLLAPAPAHAASPGVEDEAAESIPFVDPRRRPMPRRHRFRMGVEVDYIRLSAAVDESTGESQRFHFVPLQLDFAYQVQFLKVLMARPSLALGPNVGNSLEAMPFLIHPQIHTGYQGRLFGAAFGYGFFGAPFRQKDAVSAARGGLGQPVIRNNHHVGGEVSLTTRVHKSRSVAPGAGELSFQFRLAGVESTTYHFDLVRRRWRLMVMFNIGWYFGDGRRAAGRNRRSRGAVAAAP